MLVLYNSGHTCYVQQLSSMPDMQAQVTIFAEEACAYVQGPILAFIYAVKEMLEEGQGTDASLPVNVAFVFEGEEENGAHSLPHHSLLRS